MHKEAGVYSITSPSGKRYIGSTKRFDRRWKVHLYRLKRRIHHCEPLQHAYEKYGEIGLVFEILLVCEFKDLLFYEQLILDNLKPEYNVRITAGSALGMVQSLESNLKRSVALKGRSHSPERRAVIGRGGLGRKQSEETKLKRSISMTGQKRSNESRARMSASMKGISKSFEHRVKLAESLSNPIRCIETNEVFSSGHMAGRNCIERGLTRTIQYTAAAVLINRAVRLKTTAYGFHWEKIEELNESACQEDEEV